MERLVHYDWPGNIRELSNAVERATILGDGQFLEIPATDIGGATVREQAEAVASPSGASRDEIQRAHSMSVLRNTAGWSEDVRGAATFLGMHPNTFRSRMKKRAISPARL